jgi:mono/diheme cytochrome c family protein
VIRRGGSQLLLRRLYVLAAPLPHMICARMASTAKIARALAVSAVAALAISACSSQSIKLAKDSPYRTGAELFLTHCAGCHTLSLVGAEGSASSVQGRLRTQAPNFNFRREGYACVAYAIENGGFSGQVMPQNIVVGSQVKAVARFLAKFAGSEAPRTPTIGGSASCSG